MRLILVLVAVCLLSACGANDRPSAASKEVAAESVGVLFTVDGITVYRFGDGGRYHYFAVQTGRPDTVTFSSWSESCGKNCTRRVDEQIDTIARRVVR